MKLVNPNYVPGVPPGITPARWNAMIAAVQGFLAAHPELPSVETARLQAIVPELNDPDTLAQFVRALNLSVVG